MTARVYAWGVRALWLLLFLSLPITSFPLLSRLAGGTMVAPLSALILFALLGVWLLPHLLRGGKLPIQTAPLLVFFLVGLLSSAVALFRAAPSFRTQGVLRNELEAIVTLAVGICFSLAVSVWGQKRDHLRLAVRAINWSGAAVLAWCVVQAVLYARYDHYPMWMWRFQEIFSSGRLFENRVTGFAFEPSWLAHQLNMLYLPYWLAASLMGFTAHRFRLWKISIENVLLVVGVAVLYKSLSRVGLLAFLVMIAFVFVLANLFILRWARARFAPRDSSGPRFQWKAFLISAGLVIVMLGVYLALLYGVGKVLSKVDYRMANLFNIQYLLSTSLLRYANQLTMAERLSFWQTGWQVFSDYPFLGVGLGNAGFYFADRLSPYSWALTEVRLVMYHLDAIPNIKSIWVRLLAETGVLGMSVFAAWYYTLWQSARFLYAFADRLTRSLGLMGMFVLVAVIIEGFSVDTFALPYYWVSFGLVAGACLSVYEKA